jgi:uncharacterized protein with HEPN domain
MRDQREWLLDIMEAIERIERYSQTGKQAFKDDELIQTWMVHHLQIIGEAAGRLDRAFHESHPQIPWPQIVAMRNILVHEYFGLDLEEIWQVVENEVPQLKKDLAGILAPTGRGCD